MKQPRGVEAFGVEFESLLDAAPDAMVVVDDDGFIRLVNRQTEMMFGHERSALIGQPIELLVPARVAAVHSAHRTAFFNRHSVRPMGLGLEISGKRQDGTEFPVDISLSPVQTVEGPLVVAAVRDITERRREQAMFRGLLESAPDAIVVVDEKGLIRIVNRQTERMFGYAREELIGNEIGILVPDRVAARHPLHRVRYMKQPGARAMAAGLESSCRRKDGTEFPVDISLSPLETEEGTLVSAAVRDVTERKGAEKELRALEALRRTDEERRRLLSGLVHGQEIERKKIADDIHDDSIQVVSAIGLRLHLLRRKVGDLPEVRDVMDRLEETVELATQRLRRLMFELRPRILDVEGLQSTLRVYLTEMAAETSIGFELNERMISEPESEIRVILYRIAQEALTNVRKHSNATKIEVTAEESSDGYEVTVSDNGSGFAVERAHEENPIHVGLASMRERAEMAGGRWQINSVIGEGTVVKFWLPREPVSASVASPSEEAGWLLREQGSSRPTLPGIAATAKEALQSLEARQVDVALLDIRLGNDDGIALCREVRSLYPEVRCLIFTAMTGEEALVEAVLAGASGYVVKTAKSGELAEAIRRVAQGEQLLDAIATASLMDRLRRDQGPGPSTLTPQEERVLTLIGEGLTNREIAGSLFVAEQTIKNYVSNIFSKLGVKTRVEAALFEGRQRRPPEVG
ncbi:MAG: PAS domain S-box protein [Actinobacteria bacterium]|nr:PAS domain S-box protein [Actinomycetota bacterium]